MSIDMCEFKKALEDLDKLSSSLDSDSFVIDVLELCKKLNILVKTFNTSGENSEFANTRVIYSKDQDTIYVNKNLSVKQFRFYVACGLGLRFLFNEDGQIEANEFNDKIQLCMRFARNVLMPKRLLKKAIHRYKVPADPILLSKVFGVENDVALDMLKSTYVYG